jgi:hypothetical protein
VLITTTDRRSLALIAALLSAAAPGCGGSSASAPAAVDTSQARDLLTSTLDAWRSGETADSLATRSPAVHVKDYEWRGGAKLEAYEVKGTGTPSGPEWRCQVLLTLRGNDGKLKKRPASYSVATSPVIAIIRDDG